ncbi:DUF1972 domain-containing protein [Bifidobacterium amazonense]|uniref:DUF1972 domain-containing protein n=1 Tax=Bifidobacterium amazonense TaxID=2809027 RepID=UPI00237BFD9A|nr:DUF1972 domain-containing protein [Bifidobacterium amazonense]
MQGRDETVQHVFIVGSKGIPGNYGGYETFVDRLTEYHADNRNLKYHVACKSNGDRGGGDSPTITRTVSRLRSRTSARRRQSIMMLRRLIIV